MTEVKPTAEFRTQPSPANSRAAQHSGLLQDVDLANIHASLASGDDALARRKDLGELHKRIVSLFTTLNQGIGEAQANRATEDRAQVIARLDQVEHAVNSMEGALRIELEPLLRGIVADATMGNNTAKRGKLGAVFRTLIVAIAACIFGATYSSEIANLSKSIFPNSVVALLRSDATPPDGGSLANMDMMK